MNAKRQYTLTITEFESGEVELVGVGDDFTGVEVVGYLEFVKHGIVHREHNNPEFIMTDTHQNPDSTASRLS